MYAKEALMLSIKNSNNTVYEFISVLENEINIQAKKGLRACEGEITIQPQLKEFDINISDVINYFQIKEYKVFYERSVSPFNQAITYKIKLEWEMLETWISLEVKEE
jgi:hypothetical protein